MTLVEQINQGLKEAIKLRDQLRVDTLRMLKSKILAADARANLSDADVIKLFKTYASNLREAVEQTKQANRPETIKRLEDELKIVEEFLPKNLSPEETLTIVKEAVIKSNAKTKKELGLVMKQIMSLNLPIDGKLARELASQLLPDG
jgi:uncharacterized protein